MATPDNSLVTARAHPRSERVADPYVVVLFGATGDLAQRRLLPGMFHLMEAGLLSDFRIIGTSLDDLDDEQFRQLARSACEDFSRDDVSSDWDEYVSRLSFVPLNEGPDGLRKAVESATDAMGGKARYLHYLSVPPSAAGAVIRTIGKAGLVDGARVIMEKPFGTDLASARALNAEVHEVFSEDQIFRIDHFLGKEAAQNILAFRFANGLFEPIWNRDHIDHVQIDVPETLPVRTPRAAFYEQTGAFRDMVVTHLFQVLAFTAMEPPTALEPAAIMEEKQKVFRSMKPLDPNQVVRGQYEGYCSTPGVSPDSDTETFVALRCEIDNWRWAGVPFFLRTGKRMAEEARIISIAFREPPRSMFPGGGGAQGPDHLTFDLQEEFRVSLSFYGKKPGPGMQLYKSSMQFSLPESGYQADALEAYERLIHDAMCGDHTLFNNASGVERLWDVSAPLLENPPEMQLYRQGSWGPQGVKRLIEPYSWRLPFERPWRSHH
jgi:glucose-6-phosphate 1-dehydrogenase